MINKSKNENCKADLVLSAVEKFAQVIPLNLQEIFIWYFEQKGVDNSERFLAAGVNEGAGVNIKDTRAVPESNAVVNDTESNAPELNDKLGEITTKVSHQPDLDVQPQVQQEVNPELFIKMLEMLLPLLQNKKDKTTSDFSEFMEQVEKYSKNL